MLPPGTFVIGSGISIGDNAFAIQPDPARRLPSTGPLAEIITVKDNVVYNLSRSNDRENTKNLLPDIPPVPKPLSDKEAVPVTVTGTVRDQQGAPVPLAVVRLLEVWDESDTNRNGVYWSTPTDSTGRFVIEQVEAKTYRLAVVKVDPTLGHMTSPMPTVDLTLPNHPLHYEIILSAPILPRLPTKPAPASPTTGKEPSHLPCPWTNNRSCIHVAPQLVDGIIHLFLLQKHHYNVILLQLTAVE